MVATLTRILGVHSLALAEDVVEWAILSRDGKRLVYDSDESGRLEVYVAPYPAMEPRERISTDGGPHPLCSLHKGGARFRRSGRPGLEAGVSR
jgi:hypothetical protein